MRSIEGVTEEQFKRRPPATATDPEPWSIAEVLAHLLATSRIWGERINLALTRDDAEVASTDPAAHEAQARAGRFAPVPQLIHGLLAADREFALLIERAAREATFGHSLRHPIRGQISVAWMLQTYAIEHEAEHAAQIEALRQIVGAKPGPTDGPRLKAETSA